MGSKQLTLGILITTMNEGIHRVKTELLPQLKNVDEVIISHQITDENILPEKEDLGDKVKYYFMRDAGVSKNRNNAIWYASTDICHICDDDICFLEGFEDTIKKQHEKRKDIGIITFEFQEENGKSLKKYPQAGKHKKSNVLNFGGIEITFKLKDITEQRLLFDSDFGFSKYIGGEDGIFLTDAIKKGIKGFHENIRIGVHPEERNWEMWNKNNIQDKGAVLYRIFGVWCFLINIYFSIIKYKEYKGNVSFFVFLYLIQFGSIKFLKQL